MLHERRFFNKMFRGAIREVYSVGIDTETWEIKVRFRKFWREQLQEKGTYSVTQFLASSQYPEIHKSSLRKILGEWPGKVGLLPETDTVYCQSDRKDNGLLLKLSAIPSK